MRPPRALLFDLDDTLLDWASMDEALERTCSVVASAHGAIDALAVAAANRLVWETYWPEVEAEWMVGSLATEAVGREAWRRTLQACGIDDPALADLARDVLEREERSGYRLHGDAAAALGVVAARMPVGLVTNGAPDTQRAKLTAVGIHNAFGVVAISGEVGAAKPSSLIFNYALGALGVAADEVWHVGDSLVNDVGGAQAAGIAGVWLNRPRRPRLTGEPVPDAEVTSLAQLVALLDGQP